MTRAATLLLVLFASTTANAQLRIANDQVAVVAVESESGAIIDSRNNGHENPKTHEQSPLIGLDVSIQPNGVPTVTVATLDDGIGHAQFAVKATVNGHTVGPIWVPVDVVAPGGSGGETVFTGNGIVIRLLYFQPKP